MAVTQLKDGRWMVYGRPGFFPDDPKRTREYFGHGKVAERMARDRDWKLKARSGRTYRKKRIRAKSLLFEDLAHDYYIDGTKRMTASTLKSLEYLIYVKLIPAFGQTPCTQIDKRVVDKYVMMRLETVRYKDDDGEPVYISPTTVHNEVVYLQAILNWGVEQELIPHNPVAKYKKPKRRDRPSRPPTVEEARAIIAAAQEKALQLDSKLAGKTGHVARALTLAWHTGIRPGPVEMFRLRYKDIDWDNEFILVVSAEKGAERTRIVPLTKELKRQLEKWKKEDFNKADLIIHYKGKKVVSIKQAFKTAKINAGITRRLRLYDFRHQAITSMVLKGGDIKSISNIAGHARTDTTTNIYTHANLESLRAAMRGIKGLEDE
jgi:integrase